MKIPLFNIRGKMRVKGYDPDDILMFAKKAEIENLKKIGDYKGDKY